MKYRAGERRKAIEYEKAIAKWWKEDKTFEKSIEERPIDKSYVFYDGPPFATPVSKAEVTMDNDAYQKVTDPSAYVKFKLKAGEFEDITLGGIRRLRPRSRALRP